MIALTILNAILIIVAVVVAVATGHEIDRLKAQLAELEEARLDASRRLREAQEHSASLEASRRLFEKRKAEKLEGRKTLTAELDQLEQELGREHEIGLSRSLEEDPLSDPSQEQEPPPDREEDVQDEAAAEREIKVRQPMERRPLGFDDASSP